MAERSCLAAPAASVAICERMERETERERKREREKEREREREKEREIKT